MEGCRLSRLIPPSPQFCTRPLRRCSNTRTDKQTVLKVCTIINISGTTLYYASVRRGFTQSGTARSTMRRDTWRGVTIEFHAVLKNGLIRIVVGQIRQVCMSSICGIPRTAAHFCCVFCSQSLNSVRHFKRWLLYRGIDESQSTGWAGNTTNMT